MTLEQNIVQCGAPVLAGIKPAGLFSVKAAQHPHFDRDIKMLNATLQEKGLCVHPICRCRGNVLLFVYRQSMLEQSLCGADVDLFLKEQGYNNEEGLDAMLERLFSRLPHCSSFPHEVGIFLGYPLVDVLGFVKHGGRNCKLCGYWKVYGDECDAQRLFDAYDRCKEELLGLYKQGVSFTQLCTAA